jgi:nucleotide-binding universal stress UspA family protein
MTPIQTILHPTDFSDHSRYAFQLACALARDHASKLIVLHVVEQPNFIPGGEVGLPAVRPPEESRKALDEQLHQLRPLYPNIALEYQLVEGNVADGILQAARDLKADLVVIGTHGRTGLGRLLMGSVAEKVVRSASCPVLSVKMPLPQTA